MSNGTLYLIIFNINLRHKVKKVSKSCVDIKYNKFNILSSKNKVKESIRRYKTFLNWCNSNVGYRGKGANDIDNDRAYIRNDNRRSEVSSKRELLMLQQVMNEISLLVEKAISELEILKEDND